MYVLANPNSDAATTERMRRIAACYLPRVIGWTAPKGAPLLTNPAQLDTAADLIADLMPPIGCKGVIVSAFGDPGAARLAARLTCPVVGIGSAAAQSAAQGGRRFAVATTTPALVDRIDALMGSNCAAGHYLGCFVTNELVDTLMNNPALLDAALGRAVSRAQQAGAQAVIIGGGPLGEAAMRLNPSFPQLSLIQPIVEAARLIQTGKTMTMD